MISVGSDEFKKLENNEESYVSIVVLKQGKKEVNLDEIM